MTRGKMIYIDKDGNAYITVEFNGDMYPDGKAGEILERFEEGYFKKYSHYEHFAERFNARNYGYAEDLIQSFSCEENRVINVTENWTDYLYIINESEEEWSVKGKEGNVSLPKQSLGIVHFQQVKRIIRRKIKDQTEKQTPGLTREEFASTIYKLRDSSDLVEKVEELFRNSRENVECDFCNGAGLQISHENIVIWLLKKLMQDESENIDYFVYELDYGRKYEPGAITDETGEDIELDTAEKLYDYLMGENI